MRVPECSEKSTKPPTHPFGERDPVLGVTFLIQVPPALFLGVYIEAVIPLEVAIGAVLPDPLAKAVGFVYRIARLPGVPQVAADPEMFVIKPVPVAAVIDACV